MKSNIIFFLFSIIITNPSHAFDPEIQKRCIRWNYLDGDTSLSPEEIYNKHYKHITAGAYVWYYLGYPNLNVRKAIYMAQKKVASGTLNQKYGYVYEDLIRVIEDFKINGEKEISKESINYLESQINKYFYSSESISPGFSKYADKVAPLCLRYGDLNCKNAVTDLLEIMNSVYINGITTSAPNVIRNLFSDSKLRFVLANVALTINDRVNKLTSPGVSTSTDRRNIQQIITDALRAAGYSRNESEDLFYTIIALYGTRGANLDSIYEFLDKDNYIINLAMQIISVGISILEFESSDPTERFHLPQNIKSSCNFMNPYHFWMSAYLSRELVKKGYSKRTAFNAVHITSVGYQLMANNWGRDPRVFLMVDHNHRFMDYLRSTVIFDDAGALYGTGFLKNMRWDLDVRTKILFDQYVPIQIKEKNREKVFQNLALRYSVWSLLTPHNRAFPLITGGIQIQSEVRGETLFETDDFKNYDFTADDYDLNQNYDLIK